MRTASFLSSLNLINTEPSFASLSERDAETFWPFFLKISIAFSKSPSASVRAFLQSIIPAPVIWRSLFTSCAEIADILIVDLDFYDLAQNKPSYQLNCLQSGRTMKNFYFLDITLLLLPVRQHVSSHLRPFCAQHLLYLFCAPSMILQLLFPRVS